MEFSGRVVKKAFAPGSKSAHEAVLLVTDEETYKLRRTGGHAFHDPALEALVGKKIRCQGKVAGYSLIIDTWDLLGEG